MLTSLFHKITVLALALGALAPMVPWEFWCRGERIVSAGTGASPVWTERFSQSREPSPAQLAEQRSEPSCAERRLQLNPLLLLRSPVGRDSTPPTSSHGSFGDPLGEPFEPYYVLSGTLRNLQRISIWLLILQLPSLMSCYGQMGLSWNLQMIFLRRKLMGPSINPGNCV